MIWGKAGDELDYASQIYQRTVQVKLLQPGAGGFKSGAEGKVLQSVTEVVAQRMYTLQEIRLLGMMTGFSVEGVFGDFADIPLTDDEAYRMLVVMKRA